MTEAEIIDFVDATPADRAFAKCALRDALLRYAGDQMIHSTFCAEQDRARLLEEADRAMAAAYQIERAA
jgi:hypothetical protein